MADDKERHSNYFEQQTFGKLIILSEKNNKNTTIINTRAIKYYHLQIYGMP